MPNLKLWELIVLQKQGQLNFLTLGLAMTNCYNYSWLSERDRSFIGFKANNEIFCISVHLQHREGIM